MISFWDEQWKPIKDFEWGYYISNFGRIKGPRKMLIAQANNRGYLQVGLYKFRSTKPYRCLVSRLVAQAFLDEPTAHDAEVHHKDGDVTNNHADNLEWVAPSIHSRAGINT